MLINNVHYRTIWENPDGESVEIINQTKLPHRFETVTLRSPEDIFAAIADMLVRGAPLIGATAAYGVWLAAKCAARSKDFDHALLKKTEYLKTARPTAVNLAWAVNETLKAVSGKSAIAEKIDSALLTARKIADDDAAQCRRIGEFGCSLIEDISKKKRGAPVNILTHCNAGWLATVDWGTALAPIYVANEKNIPLHVWVDETRPRNQGSKLTAFELLHQGISHTIIADNTGGHLMQKGMVDVVIVGSDRTTVGGDVANKIGTYLKALAAADNGIPFFVALPSSTIDWGLDDGIAEIPIEQRNADEVRIVEGLSNGEIVGVLVPPGESPAANYAFDVTPRRLVTGLITERGICKAEKSEILRLFPEKRNG